MTKKVAALALSLLLPALASASDLNPGALQLSGKTAFDWQSESVDTGGTKVDTTRVGGGISAMYYVSHFLAFGLAADYEREKIGDETTSAFLFGPKAGIDYELMEHLSLFADLTVGITRGDMKDPGGTNSGNGYGYEIAAGFKLFLNRNVSLDLLGAFEQLQYSFTGFNVTRSNVTAGVGLSVYLTNNPANSEQNQFRTPPAGYQPYPPNPEYR